MSGLAPASGPAVCPACAAALPKLPQRKTKCKACGQFMYVRSSPDDRSRRLMTEAQMLAAEAAWGTYGAAQMVRAELQNFGAVAADYPLPPTPVDVQAAVAKARQLAQGKGPMRQVLMGLYRAAQTPTDALAAMLAVTALDMAEARTKARAMTVQLRVPKDSSCARCKPLQGTLVPSDAPAAEVMPLDCPRLMTASGRARGMCEVMVSAWIRGPDGRDRVDRLPAGPVPERGAISPESLEEARQAWSNVLGVDLPAAPAAGTSAEPPAPQLPWWRRMLGPK